MTVVRWNPFSEVNVLRDSINRIFEEAVRNREAGAEESAFGAWAPVVDIHENENTISISAELPGISEKEIDIQVNGNVLTISGEKKVETEKKEGSYHRTERVFGTFRRSFTLPQTVDQENIGADYKDGVLTVSLPKVQEAKPKKINIKTAE